MAHLERLFEGQEQHQRWDSWADGLQSAGDVVSASYDKMTGAMSSRVFRAHRESGKSKFEFEQALKWGIANDLRVREDPSQLMATFMEKVDQLQEEIGDNAYSFVRDEEERQQAVDESRAVRRSNIAAAKYILLKEWKQYIADLRTTATDDGQNAYCNAWDTAIEQAGGQLMIDECAIENPDVM